MSKINREKYLTYYPELKKFTDEELYKHWEKRGRFEMSEQNKTELLLSEFKIDKKIEESHQMIKKNIKKTLNHQFNLIETNIHEKIDAKIDEELKNIEERLNDKLFGFLSEEIRKIKKYLKNIESNQITKPIEKKKNKNRFVIIIPSYNNEKWVEWNLNSVINQSYNNWRIIYVNDSSTDNTMSKLENIIRENGISNKVTIINQRDNMGQAYSRYMAFQKCNDDEIILLLDGDDWLYNQEVLEKIDNFYKNNDILFSYGNYYNYENGEISQLRSPINYPKSIIENNKYHYFPYITNHLRCGYALLFKKIKKEYIKDFEGNYLNMCTDVNEMLWLLINSQGKFKPHPFITYVYNKDASKENYNSFWNINVNLKIKKKHYQNMTYIRSNLISRNIEKSILMITDLDYDDESLYEFTDKLNKDFKIKIINFLNLDLSKYNFEAVIFYKFNNLNNDIIDKIKKYNIMIFCDMKIENTIYYHINNVTKILDYQSFKNYQSLFDFIDNTSVGYVSFHLGHFKNRFFNKFDLKEYPKNNGNKLFIFGCYQQKDVNVIRKFNGIKYIVWGGSDIHTDSKYFDKLRKQLNLNNIIHIAISDDIEECLGKYNFNYYRINFDLLKNNLFKPLNREQLKQNKKIYIYNGHPESINREEFYGEEIYQKVVEKLISYYGFENKDFIYSNQLDKEYEEMPDVYKDCFVGLRLCQSDGNANTVQEFELMNIPIIHNSSKYGIKWKTWQEVLLYIISLKYQFSFPKDLKQENLPMINDNIKAFINLLEPYKRILILTYDYPGYGGAANNSKLIQDLILQNTNNKVLNIYICDDEKFILNDNKSKTISYMGLNSEISRIKEEFNPEIVILKSPITLPVEKKFDVPIIFLVPGIFKNNLDKYYKYLDKQEIDKYINKKVLSICKISDIVLVNSSHVKDYLKEKFNINSQIFYSSFVNYYNKKPIKNNNNYKYEYGVIISNFDRNIKNFNNILQKLNKLDGKKILIGKNSSKYESNDIETMELIPQYKIYNYYPMIKNIIIDNNFDSCSNVMIESWFNGVKITSLKNIDNNRKQMNIIIMTTQLPFNGGSSTLAYHYHRYLLNLGYNSYFYTLIHRKHIYKVNQGDYELNPENLPNVKMLPNNYNDFKKYTWTSDEVKFINNIDKLISVNYGVVPVIKHFYTGQIIYQIVGSPEFTLGKNSLVNKDVSYNKLINNSYNLEEYKNNLNSRMNQETMDKSEIILANSENSLNIYKKFFPDKKIDYIGSIEHEIYRNYFNLNDNITIESKDIDLIVVSSRWDRKVKNVKLVYDLYKNFPKLNKVIIGKLDETYNFKDLENTLVFDNLPNEKVQEYMKKTKLLLVPSLFESASITLLEGLKNNCNILTSKNVGLYKILPEKCVVKDMNYQEWKYKLEILLDEKDISINRPDIIEDKLINLLNRKKNILIASIDVPNIGGAATNSYNLLKILKKTEYNGIGLFVSNLSEYNLDPDNVGDIYHLSLNKNLNNKSEELKELLLKTYGKIDAIFAKNYKITPILKKMFPDTKLIFSPSGLRYITNQISTSKKWYNELKQDEQIFKNLNDYKMIPSISLFKFIRVNDQYLDSYALDNADKIICNSKLSYEIVKNSYKTLKIDDPIYLTNISKVNNKGILFNDRKYDLAFISHSWKRECKNYDLALELIEKNKDKKILIIGNHQTKIHQDENITQLEFINKKELLEILNNIKTIVITSKYDSNPNILIEASYTDCNIIASTNVGNSENLNEKLLVKEEKNINEWQEKINNSLVKHYPYKGPNIEEVKTQFLNLFKNI